MEINPQIQREGHEILPEFCKPRYARICVLLKTTKGVEYDASGRQTWGLGRLEKGGTIFLYEILGALKIRSHC